MGRFRCKRLIGKFKNQGLKLLFLHKPLFRASDKFVKNSVYWQFLEQPNRYLINDIVDLEHGVKS